MQFNDKNRIIKELVNENKRLKIENLSVASIIKHSEQKDIIINSYYDALKKISSEGDCMSFSHAVTIADKVLEIFE
jgi:hypothetical protein